MKYCPKLLVAVALTFAFAATGAANLQAQDSNAANHESTFKWLRRQFNTPTFYEKRHASVLSAYEDCVRQARLATVSVQSNGNTVALGTVVQADGYILTKASELQGELTCILSDGRKLPAEIVGEQRRYDLAMLRVQAKNLPTIRWSEIETEAGILVATPGRENYPVSVGVVSVAARRIESPSGVLGVLLTASEQGALVEEVFSGSSAAQAGLKNGDTIVAVNGEEIKTREQLIRTISEYQPGDRVRLRITRENNSNDVLATLGERTMLTGQTPLYVQNTLGGPISARRSGFPRAIQHDTVLEPNQCGGPVVDLEGRAIGLNIARAGRVASYAIPASDIRPMLSDFVAGVYAPNHSVVGVKTVSSVRGE